MIGREYEYRLKADRVMVRAFLFAAGAVGLGYMAATNDRALILFCLPLSQKNATIAYAVFAAISAIIAASDFVNASRRGSLVQRIAFKPEGLIVPASKWTTEETVIPYTSIRKMQTFNEPETAVVISHEGGEMSIYMNMLADERAFSEVVNGLAEAVTAAHGGAPMPKEPPPADPELAQRPLGPDLS